MTRRTRRTLRAIGRAARATLRAIGRAIAWPFRALGHVARFLLALAGAALEALLR